MIPVDQQQLYDPKDESPWGDCVASCIASILEIPLEQIPARHFCHCTDGTQTMAVNNYLKQFGLGFVRVPVRDGSDWSHLEFLLHGVYHTMGGPGPRGCGHEVVGKGMEMVHDPHPSKLGILEVEDVGIFVCREPELLIRSRRSTQ